MIARTAGMNFAARPAREAGFTLVELMIAIVLALMLGAVLAAVLLAQSSANRVQMGMRRSTENARYALNLISADIRNAAHQFCMNYSPTSASAAASVVQVSDVRSIQLLFDASSTPWSLGDSMATAPYYVDPATFMLASECDQTICSPDVSAFRPVANVPLPEMGTTAGSRALGADVISLRYLASGGVAVASIQSQQADDVPASLNLETALPATVQSALISDCSHAVGAKVVSDGAGKITLSQNFSGHDDALPSLKPEQTRVFDMEKDFTSVSYYLRLKTYQPSNGAQARLISSLVRRVNGVDVEVADGIERLDFLFHVERLDGTTSVLSADALAAVTDCRGAAVPAEVLGVASCGWRSIKGVEIHLLANSVDDVDRPEDGFRYAWKNDGSLNDSNSFESLGKDVVLRNGLPAGRLLRKGFSTFVSLRGYNH